MTRIAPRLRERVIPKPPGIATLLALVCVLFALVFAVSADQLALAETNDTDASPDALQLEIERTATAYDEAVAEAQKAEDAISEHNERIAELEKAIPAQQEKSNAAAVDLYKFGQQMPGVLDFLLNSESFYDLLTNIDYVNYITDANMREINRLIDMKAELDAETASLQQAKADANARVDEAKAALVAAQEARMEAQRKAQEAARQKAEAAAAASAAGQGGKPASTTTVSPDENGASSDSGDDAGAAATDTVVETETVVDDGANWSSDEAAFVQSWAGRIDAYLAGTPLAGQGTTFAQAAWNYGVDPRWSPAISFTESTCGTYCFLPHNAWGWGSSSWGSWEEAIDAHVRGLARGYGYTISMEAAQKYCPPNAEHWYNTTLAQMNQI